MNFYGNTQIIYEGKNITYVLSVGIDLEKNVKYLPSFVGSRKYGEIEEHHNFLWDNDYYLYHTFYKQVLIPWDDSKEVINSKEFSNFLRQEGVNIDDISTLRKIFDKADEMGFFDKVKKETNGTE